MYDDVLVPVDGSEPALEAVDHAADIATQYDAQLHLLYVVDVREEITAAGAGTGSGAPAIEEALEEEAEQALSEAAERVPDDVDVQQGTHQGVPHEEILAYVESWDVDLVVMGTHGRTGVERYVLGSVTERVVRLCDVPVLTVGGA